MRPMMEMVCAATPEPASVCGTLDKRRLREANEMRCIAGSLAACLIAGSAVAADLECTQIKLVVPYPAGGATDVSARVVGERLEAALKGRETSEPSR
jgi:hypothetical protein